MKKILIIALLFLNLFANGQNKVIVQDIQAEPILDNISKTFNTKHPFQLEFKYEIYSSMEDAKISDFGNIIIHGEKYKLSTEDTEIFFNGQYLWSFNKLNEEVYKNEIESGSPDQAFIDPFRLLGNYKEFFKYRFMGENIINGKKLFLTELYPKQLDTPYSMIKLFSNEKGDTLHSLLLKQKDGVDIHIFINEIINDLKIPDSVFEWNPKNHPNVLLIEM